MEEALAARLESKYIKGQELEDTIVCPEGCGYPAPYVPYVKGQELEDTIICQEGCGRGFSGKARKQVNQR